MCFMYVFSFSKQAQVHTYREIEECIFSQRHFELLMSRIYCKYYKERDMRYTERKKC